METESQGGLLSSIENVTFAASRRWQKLMDDSVTYIIPRYITLLVLILLYFVRVYFVAGFYIITYALGIYSLSLFIEFLSPLEDPEYANAETELPTKNDEEYKPFIRKLPEFHLWYYEWLFCFIIHFICASLFAVLTVRYQLTKSFTLALFCTFFDFLDIPVFWPILLMYFLILFFVSIKERIKHMIKHKYVPLSVGKPKFPGKSEGV
jgi:hypothetical protein